MEHFMSATSKLLRVLTVALVLGAASGASAADDGVWQVSKSSGEVWTTTSGAQPVSLGQQAILRPGDTIRTGRNGRVLLTRGEETILVSPNSVIGLPTEKKDGLSTTIEQQAGSILLEVEKRNVQHFEVETPYLAAVVKGTQFRVSVNANSTSVSVFRGQVEVADFKSGQIAQVMPGQVATASEHGKSGLSLSGSGTFNPIEQGKPRASSIERIMVPKTGLSGPSSASAQPATTRISTALGEVSLNFQKVTHGLAHGMAAAPGSVKRNAEKDTIWNSREAKASPGAGYSNSSEASANSGSASAGANMTTTSGAAVPVAAVTTAQINPGNEGANGNGKALGIGNGNGNGRALGHIK
jgi:hypothetical protein